jgi:hypothetical protein
MTFGAFGGVAGVFAIFFFSDIPRVRRDIMQVGEPKCADSLGEWC